MMNKRKILLVSDMNFPFGGASANLLRLFATGISKNNKNVTVVLQRGRQYGNKKNISKGGIIDSVKYWYCCFTNRPQNYILKVVDDIFGVVIPLVYILIQSISGRLECVIMYTSNAQFSVFTILLCRLFKIPIFNIVTEWHDKSNLEQNTLISKIKSFYFKLQVKYFNTKFNGLIVLSHFLKDIYVNANVSETKILIQPNLVDFSTFVDIENISQHNKIRIGYCGTPTRKDGIDDLLIAFEIVQRKSLNTELLVIGDTSAKKSLLLSLKDKAKELGILDKVIFTGLVDSDEIPRLLNSCDILVLARPSGLFAEAGFPTKLGEYLACKKPVVITKVGDIPLYLKNGESAMLAEPDNPQSVADKILYLIENSIRAKDIGENGFIWAKNNLEYRQATNTILNFIENICDCEK